MKKLTLLTLAILISSTAAFAQEVGRYPYMNLISGNDRLSWKVTKASWTAADEDEFGAFVQQIGLAAEAKKCRSFQSCMTNPAVNKFYNPADAAVRYFADCADVPYWLRIYFAWKKGLPMSMTSNTVPRDPNDPKGTSRNSTILGNRVSQRADSIARNGRFPDITQFLSSISSHGLILDSVSSGTLRTPVKPDASEPLADFYPIAINRASVKPGTVVYTADGHVAIVYKIDLDGNIRTLNGHPADPNAAQSPLSVRDYNDTFKRSRQEHGSIFKNFRPLEVVGFTRDVNGFLIGGSVRFKSDAEINASGILAKADTQQVDRKFGSTSDYFMFVRRNMASGDLKMDVVLEFKRSLKNVCDTVQGRVELVDQAARSGIDSQELVNAPENIFSTHGEWENYSTPSRDVNIRVLFKKALDDLRTSVRALRAGDTTYVYAKPLSQLPQELLNVYKEKALSCTVSFTSRAGVQKTLNLEEVRQRMFKISFDPYQCADLRWGDEAAGKASCPEDMRWYNAQQYLRNMTEKVVNNTNLTVDQMERENSVRNKSFEWNTDVRQYIVELNSVINASAK